MTTTKINPITVQIPAGCSTRAGKLSDYKQTFELVNAYAQLINGRDDLDDPELIRLDWQNPDFNPETDIHTVFDPNGKLIGLTECWLTSHPPVHPWNWICVHPDYLDKGIWEYLLVWAENRSRSALNIVPQGVRVAARTGTEHHNLAGVQAIQSLGWNYNRSYYQMQTDLNETPEVPPSPDNIIIRTYDPATETEAVYRAFVDSFKDHFGFVEQPFEHGFANFKHNLINEPGYDPNFWFVAVDGNEIAGICLCRLKSSEDPQCGWVNELGVRRAWRKKGLGTILLKQAFAAFYASGQKRAALGVDASSLTGALRLYERAGMRSIRQYDNFEKEFQSGEELATQELK